MMPASPASAPEMAKVKSTSRSALKPEKRAARGAAPTSRISNPMIMRPSSTVASITTIKRDDRAGVQPAAFDQVGTEATGSKAAVVGKFKPVGSRQGPRTR